MNYQQGNVNYDWNIKDNLMNYIPGSVRMRITQYASVDVEYLGGPIYIPRSADPNYEDKAVG